MNLVTYENKTLTFFPILPKLFCQFLKYTKMSETSALIPIMEIEARRNINESLILIFAIMSAVDLNSH